MIITDETAFLIMDAMAYCNVAFRRDFNEIECILHHAEDEALIKEMFKKFCEINNIEKIAITKKEM